MVCTGGEYVSLWCIPFLLLLFRVHFWALLSGKALTMRYMYKVSRVLTV